MEDQFPKSVLVTGGLGFIGSHLTEALLGQGCKVTVLDDLSSGNRGNLPRHHRGLLVVVSDILSAETAEKTVAGADAVVHLAALVGVRNEAKDRLMEVNVRGTKNVVQASVRAGVRTFVLASSLAVYGEWNRDRRPQLDPQSDYGKSKLAAEETLREAASSHNVSALALRFSNVYGPRMPRAAEGAVTIQFARSLVQSTPLKITGDGRQTRDFIHVSDIVTSIMSALGAAPPGFNALDIGTGLETSIKSLAHMFLGCSGKQLPLEHLPALNETRRSRATTEPAKEMLGFTSKVPLRRGVEDLIRWELAHGPSASVQARYGRA